MGEFFDDITRDLRDIRKAAEECVVPLREVDAATSQSFSGNGGPSIVGSFRGSGVLGSGRGSSLDSSGRGGKFKDVREVGNIVRDLVSGDYGGAVASITKEVAKKFGVKRTGIAVGAAIYAATSAVAVAGDRIFNERDPNSGVGDVAVALRANIDLGGRRASAQNASALINAEVTKQIGKLKGDGGILAWLSGAKADIVINNAVGREGWKREAAETISSYMHKLSFGITPEMTDLKTLREKASAEVQKEAGKVAAAVAAGYEKIGLGDLIGGSNNLKEANKFDPNIGKMWYSPGSIYMGMEASRIAGVNFAASKMKRAGPRIGD